jgi:methionine synthase II (cobalamin-independent)
MSDIFKNGKARNEPPFRFDTVGSFLRPKRLKEARANFNLGKISGDDLEKVEDEEIIKLVDKQKEIGLQVVTDGEFRRSWWHLDFFWGLGGVSKIVTPEAGFKFKGIKSREETARLHSKLYYEKHPFLEHFKFLKKIAKDVVVKQTIPAPARFYTLITNHINEFATEHYYPNKKELLDDIVKSYRAVIKDFYDAGLRYIQLDDTTWGNLAGSLNDVEFGKSHFTDKDGDFRSKAELYLDLNNRVIDGLPKDLIVATHVCKGNFQSTWTATGGYDSVAEFLFREKISAFFLEYDDERSGDFKPLSQFPKDQNTIVVLGIFTSKYGKLEDKKAILERIKDATNYVDINQIALSPQCGFASTEEGNILTEEEQWNKLKYIKSIVDEIWK